VSLIENMFYFIFSRKNRGTFAEIIKFQRKMPIFRFKALEKVMDRKPKFVSRPSNKISEYYGENVFNRDTMRQYLTNDAYKKVIAEAIYCEYMREV